MTSDTPKKTFIEQNLTSRFTRPKNKIKPLTSISTLHQDLNEEKLKKKLALHSATGKDFSFTPKKSSVSFSHSIKNSLKALRNQHHLSELHYRENNNPYFENNFFFSNLKHLPCLSSLKLNLSGASHDTLKSFISLLVNLSSYKRLTHLDLQFLHFQISDRKLLRLLFRDIQALRPTLKSLCILIIHCRNMSDKDLRVFSSYIGKFTQLEALKLIFHSPPVFND